MVLIQSTAQHMLYSGARLAWPSPTGFSWDWHVLFRRGEEGLPGMDEAGGQGLRVQVSFLRVLSAVNDLLLRQR